MQTENWEAAALYPGPSQGPKGDTYAGLGLLKSALAEKRVELFVLRCCIIGLGL